MTSPTHTIIIVEDELLLARTLQRALQMRLPSAYTIEHYDTPAAALSAIAATPVALLITDLRLAGANGLDLIHTLRATRPTAQAILMTAFGTYYVQEIVAEENITYLSKPFTLQQFVTTVEQILAHHPPTA